MSFSLSDFEALSPSALTDRILEIKRKMGRKLLFLAHYYQKDELFRLADLSGDSYQLSARAAVADDAEVILFCGVHFMAETADILVNSPDALARRNGRRVRVLLPDSDAGCTMAEMATSEMAEEAWSELGQVLDTARLVPITYVNSPASVKAFCGRHGGAACTSSNAHAVLDWAFGRGDQVLFLPDQYLGRNTGRQMGFSDGQMILWNHRHPALARELTRLGRPDPDWKGRLGGNTEDQIRGAKLILWNGFCTVHQRFTVSDLDRVRRENPGVTVIVHPECSQDVVSASDVAGSTALILRKIDEAPAGSCWAIGTEWCMVKRLQETYPNKKILNLATEPRICDMMARVSLANVAWILARLEEGAVVGQVSVDASVRSDALHCLERMLACPARKG